MCGIATDHCVRATALDGASEGFATRVLTALCVGVAQDTTAAAITEMTGRASSSPDRSGRTLLAQHHFSARVRSTLTVRAVPRPKRR